MNEPEGTNPYCITGIFVFIVHRIIDYASLRNRSELGKGYDPEMFITILSSGSGPNHQIHGNGMIVLCRFNA